MILEVMLVLVEPQKKANTVMMRHDPSLAMASALDYGRSWVE
jgi:hypothetical protein